MRVQVPSGDKLFRWFMYLSLFDGENKGLFDNVSLVCELSGPIHT